MSAEYLIQFRLNKSFNWIGRMQDTESRINQEEALRRDVDVSCHHLLLLAYFIDQNSES